MIMSIIDWILRITGVISILIGILSIFINRQEYVANIRIQRANGTIEDNNLKYYVKYKEDDLSGEQTMFIPQGCNIKKLEVFSLKFEKNKLKKDKCLKSYYNIPPYEGVLFDIYYAEGIPSRKIIWTCDYGVKGEHIFAENSFNGNVDTMQYCYKYGVISNIRKRIGWK